MSLKYVMLLIEYLLPLRISLLADDQSYCDVL